MKNRTLRHPIIFILVSLFIFTGYSFAAIPKEQIKTIAIIPFQINASQDFDYIQNGMIRMLDSRLSWRDIVAVVPTKVIKRYLSNMDDISGAQRIEKIAKLTHSDFVLSGSITGIGGAFSIDINVYDIENKRFISFFEQSKTIDGLINKTDRIAATINKKVFDRITVSWEKIEQEKQAYVKEQKRRNPEYMMQNPMWQETEEKVGWKVWKYLF